MTPEDAERAVGYRTALAKARFWEMLAAIFGLLLVALIVCAVAGGIWLLAGWFGR